MATFQIVNEGQANRIEFGRPMRASGRLDHLFGCHIYLNEAFTGYIGYGKTPVEARRMARLALREIGLSSYFRNVILIRKIANCEYENVL